jgi:hypothetical protein
MHRPLFTELPGIGILRSSHKRNSAKFKVANGASGAAAALDNRVVAPLRRRNAATMLYSLHRCVSSGCNS